MEAKNNEKSMPQNRGDAKGPNNTPAKTAHKKPRKPVFPGLFFTGQRWSRRSCADESQPFSVGRSRVKSRAGSQRCLHLDFAPIG